MREERGDVRAQRVVDRLLLDAVELAALAGGCRRVVLLPAAVPEVEPFERLGYRIVNERCAGAWLEKAFT